MNSMYHGLWPYVRKRLRQGATTGELFQEAVSQYNYGGTRKAFKNYVYKCRKMISAKRGENGQNVKNSNNNNINVTEQDGLINAEVKIIDKYGSFDREAAIDHAIKILKVDLAKWEIFKTKAGMHEVPVKTRVKIGPDKNDYEDRVVKVRNWNVSIEFRPIKKSVFDEAVVRAVEKIKDIKFPVQKFTPANCDEDYAGEMALYDAHFGKEAHNEVTGQGDTNLAIAKKVCVDACEKNLNHLAAYRPSLIYYIMGNDLMHYENVFCKTPTGGFQLDCSDRLSVVIDEAIDFMIQSILMCRQVAPVEIILIQGNHDLHSALWLAKLLKYRFHDDPHINVDDTDMDKKVRLWGKLLIAWMHNATGKMQVPQINSIPDLWPQLWGRSVFREIHGGHKHKKEEVRWLPTQTKGGIIYRQIPALSTIDKWHYDNGFVDAVPAGESFVLSKKTGVQAHFTANVDYRN